MIQSLKQVNFLSHLRAPFTIPNFYTSLATKIKVIALSIISTLTLLFHNTKWQTTSLTNKIALLVCFSIITNYIAALFYKVIKIRQINASPKLEVNKDFIEAVQKNDLGKVQFLFESYSQTPYVDTLITFKNATGQETMRTPLHQACIDKNEKMAIYLLEKGANTSLTDNLKRTAVHWACEKGLSEVIKKLLEDTQADFNAADLNGDFSLTLAIKNNFVELANSLLESKKINWNKVDSAASQNLLKVVCKKGEVDFLQQLLKQPNIPINSADSKGITALDEAFKTGNQSMIKALLDAGADVLKCQNKGMSALKIAFEKEIQYNSELSLSNFLIQQGVSVDWKGNNDETPLHIACSSNLLDTVKLLVKRSKDLVNAKTVLGTTPLMRACGANSEAVALYLLNEAEADPQHANSLGYTALHYAAENGMVEAVKVFISKKTDLNVKTVNGKTPLELVTKALKDDPDNKNLKLVSELLKV